MGVLNFSYCGLGLKKTLRKVGVLFRCYIIIWVPTVPEMLPVYVSPGRPTICLLSFIATSKLPLFSCFSDLCCFAIYSFLTSYLNTCVYFSRDDHNKKPFYYCQSYEVHKLLSKAGGIDTRDRDVS